MSLGARHASKSDRAGIRKELETAEDATVIVQVGRMESLKGHVSLLKALALLNVAPGWVCWQVGGAQRPNEISYLSDLRTLVTELKIADRIRFLDERADVPKLLGAADIYCQPNTRPEAFGLTFVEALAAGLPVVTTNIGGAKEIVDDSCGILVRPNDAPALVAALRNLIEDSSLRARLGSAGPARVSGLCRAGDRLHELCGLFGSMVERRAA